MPVVHALIGLTSWAVVILGVERRQRHRGAASQPEAGATGVGDEAEAWLRAQDHPDGRAD